MKPYFLSTREGIRMPLEFPIRVTFNSVVLIGNNCNYTVPIGKPQIRALWVRSRASRKPDLEGARTALNPWSQGLPDRLQSQIANLKSPILQNP